MRTKAETAALGGAGFIARRVGIKLKIEDAGVFMAGQDPKNFRGKAHYQAGFLAGLRVAVGALEMGPSDRLDALAAVVEASRARR